MSAGSMGKNSSRRGLSVSQGNSSSINSTLGWNRTTASASNGSSAVWTSSPALTTPEPNKSTHSNASNAPAHNATIYCEMTSVGHYIFPCTGEGETSFCAARTVSPSDDRLRNTPCKCTIHRANVSAAVLTDTAKDDVCAGAERLDLQARMVRESHQLQRLPGDGLILLPYPVPELPSPSQDIPPTSRHHLPNPVARPQTTVPAMTLQFHCGSLNIPCILSQY